MGTVKRFSPEVRERAVRLVQEHQEAHESQWGAIRSIAGKIGCSPEALRKWVPPLTFLPRETSLREYTFELST